ncbi:MAG: phosphomannomutase/phosphoglucomutase, partial [Cyanobacteria bacterium P01_E01_bin.34]
MTISPAPFSNSTDFAGVDWANLQNGSDIRGVALEGVADEPVNLTGVVVTRLGHAFAAWLSATLGRPAGELTVSVGRDSRLSGPELMRAAIAGLTSGGCDVLDFGIASTPAMFMSTVLTDSGIPQCDGAIMLTASHLPFNRNGLKFFTETGGLDKKDIKAILQLAETGAFEAAGDVGAITQYDFISVYAARLVDIVCKGVNHPEHYDRPLQGLKIVMDAGNGAGGFYCDRVLAPLGADTTGSQFLDPDGTFPNHVPNPENAEAMASICGAVVE